MKDVSKYNYSRNKKCPKCDKPITNHAEYCNGCERKLRYQKQHSPAYIDGRTMKKYYCNDCDKPIIYHTALYGTGKCVQCSQQREQHPNYIDGRTYKKYYCIDCDRELSGYEAKRCKSCANKGENNPGYIDGKGKEPYPLGWNKTFKEQIRYRDNYKCQNCGCPEIECETKLDVHHIDYDKQNLDPKNLISLCRSCNVKANKNRKYWARYFQNKIKEIKI